MHLLKGTESLSPEEDKDNRAHHPGNIPNTRRTHSCSLRSSVGRRSVTARGRICPQRSLLLLRTPSGAGPENTYMSRAPGTAQESGCPPENVPVQNRQPSNRFCNCRNGGSRCQKPAQIKPKNWEHGINGWVFFFILRPGSTAHTWAFPDLASEHHRRVGNGCIAESIHRHDRCSLVFL